MLPHDPVGATSHRDPYPYYRALLQGSALAPGAQPGTWIASRAAVIAQVLAHPDCRVRPLAEAVPAAIAGGSAGAIFGRLVRMNEGPAHASAKRALGRALAGIDPARVRDATRMHARALAARHGLPARAMLTPWMLDLPTCVVAGLLGVAQAALAPLAAAVADFVRCLSPLSDAAELARADIAARSLLASVQALMTSAAIAPDGLLARVRAEAVLAGWDDDSAIAANLLGLLSQTHEATAALAGNCIVALATRPQLQARLRSEPQLADALVREVARFDPPVQNTRRFVARACTIAGEALAPGDVIIVLLAAAGRDPAVHAQPDAFLLERAPAALATFGDGRHACPGQQLATTIAAAAIDSVLALPGALDGLCWTYRASPNCRLPLFIQTPPPASKELP